MLSDGERKKLIDFIAKYADGDVLIQTANRVSNNIDDTESLIKYIDGYKMKLHAGDYVGTKVGQPREELPEQEHLQEAQEDLGPPAKKLGANGQAIDLFMRKRPGGLTIDKLKKELKLPEAKIKPMLALLIERGMAKRVGKNSYESTDPQT